MRLLSKTLPKEAEMFCGGVAFRLVDGVGMVSEEVSKEVGKRWCSIPGYSVYNGQDAPEQAPDTPTPPPEPPESMDPAMPPKRDHSKGKGKGKK